MKQKLVALLLGLLATLLVLELGIRVGYRGFIALQTRSNLAEAVEGDGALRIACIGESTTAVAGDRDGHHLVTTTAYPAQLERILRQRAPERSFEVHNLGNMAGTSSDAIDRLETLLQRRPPHVVVAMMGIKDTPDERLPGLAALPGWAASLRTVQLGAWLVEELRLHRERVSPRVERADQIPASRDGMQAELAAFVQEPRVLRLQRRDREAVLDELRVALYLWTIGRNARAEEILRALVAERDLGHNVLARVLVSEGRFAEAEALLGAAIDAHPEEPFYAIVLSELLLDDGRPIEALELLDATMLGSRRFEPRELALDYLHVAQGNALRAEGHHREALEVLQRVRRDHATVDVTTVLLPPSVLRDLALGRLFLESGQLDLAERHLLEVLHDAPDRHISMFMLGQVYARTGEHEKEEALRRQLLEGHERLAEYFELAKVYRRAGESERAPELVDEAVRRIPSLRRNYRELYALCQRHGVHLVVMQYPGFSLDLAQRYAPPAPGVSFVDNEQLFSADPDRYFFSPRFPSSFSHYTDEGAELVAQQVADAVLEVVEE
jgi:tetratricopeptide (TPR) repeat protein